MRPQQEVKRPSIFEYDDYRKFLRDIYEFYKATTQYFSYRYFAQRAGFRSPNFLKLVISGQRNLSEASCAKFVEALKLTKAEGEFFEHLVGFNQADSIEKKQTYAQRLVHSKAYSRVHPLSEAQLKYYTNWYYIPIREMLVEGGSSLSPQEMAQRFLPPLTRTQVDEALVNLEKLGLIEKSEDGSYAQTNRYVRTENEVFSPFVATYHKQMMHKASEAIERVPRSEREISSVCVSMSRDKASRIKKLIQEFRHKLLTLCEEGDSGEPEIYQINFQFFPLTQKRQVTGSKK